jgi:hypothetical protein
MTVTTAPSTVLRLLFGPVDDGGRVLWAHLPPLPPVPGVENLPAQVAGALHDLLDIPVGNLALGAWVAHRRVEEACRETAGQPGTRQVVALAEHTLYSEQHPVVDLDVGSGAATRRLLTLTLVVKIDVSAVRIVVAEGRVSEVVPAGASASASLQAGSTVIARCAPQPVELRLPRNGDTPGPPGGPAVGLA